MFYTKQNAHKFVPILLIIILIVLAFFIYKIDSFNKIRNALQKEKEKLEADLNYTHKELQTKQESLAKVSKEKDQLLMELYKEKERSYIEVESIKSKLVKVEELLHQAQNEKKFAQQEQERLSSELAGLKEELRLWEGKIKDLSERKLVLGRKAASSKELAQRIWDLKVKTQQEVDRQELEAGNCGYIVKEGKPTFTRDKVIELKKIIVSHPKQK